MCRIGGTPGTRLGICVFSNSTFTFDYPNPLSPKMSERWWGYFVTHISNGLCDVYAGVP